MAYDPSYADAIASIESGGKYGLLGPVTKSGDRAYGKYQVMGDNIGPWSKEVLGVELTPQQFLANPQYQDAVFQGKFGQYVDKYGQEGAAQAWFGGPGAVGKLERKDQLGTSVGDYGKRFMSALGPQAPALGNAPQAAPAQAPLSLAPPQQQPSVLAQLASLAPTQQQQAQPAQPYQAPQAPVLNAPQMQQIAHRINLAQAFSKIPLPQGYRGFTYGS